MTDLLDVTEVSSPELAGLPEPLVIKQFYLGCLSLASYLIGDRSSGRAIVLDPRRDIEEILGAARDEGLSIELVVQSHFHADFISGHLEVAAATGAAIAYGPGATTEFASRNLADGELIDLGSVKIEVWSTPGHTPESVSLVIRTDADPDPVAALTGDALFIGDVGRPDLLASANVAPSDLASQLYDSVHRLASLPAQTLVLPAHGAGSACGKSLSEDTVSTIGDQIRTNYALGPLSREQFIDIVTEGQPAAPEYFGFNARLNRMDRALFDEVDRVPEMGIDAIDAAVGSGAVVVDTRTGADYVNGHLEGSLSVSLDGRFAEQVGSVVSPDTDVILVGDPMSTSEARTRMGRIGFDRVLGELNDLEAVLTSQPDRSGRLSRLTAAELAERRASLGDELQFIDVRNPGEVEAGAVDGALNIPLARLKGELANLSTDRPVVLVCASGARSVIAASLLTSAGFEDVSDVIGGATALGVGAACASTIDSSGATGGGDDEAAEASVDGSDDTTTVLG